MLSQKEIKKLYAKKKLDKAFERKAEDELIRNQAVKKAKKKSAVDELTKNLKSDQNRVTGYLTERGRQAGKTEDQIKADISRYSITDKELKQLIKDASTDITSSNLTGNKRGANRLDMTLDKLTEKARAISPVRKGPSAFLPTMSKKTVSISATSTPASTPLSSPPRLSGAGGSSGSITIAQAGMSSGRNIYYSASVLPPDIYTYLDASGSLKFVDKSGKAVKTSDVDSLIPPTQLTLWKDNKRMLKQTLQSAPKVKSPTPPKTPTPPPKTPSPSLRTPSPSLRTPSPPLDLAYQALLKTFRDDGIITKNRSGDEIYKGKLIPFKDKAKLKKKLDEIKRIEGY